MARVCFEQVTKQYENGFVAVKNLNFEVAEGEFLVLVGPSGCGKTTSLRMLAGLESVSSGNIYIGDRNVNNISSKDRNIAMVFQSYALYPHMSVFDNMAFSLELQGYSRAETKERVQAAAQQLGIEQLLDRKPKQLSGGQRQRVAVGRAIVRKPTVFLMDEPLSNLDAKLRTQARVELSKLHKDLATTFIYVTHDQVEAMTMGTRIAVLNQGILQQIDTPQNLYENPANIFVAGFMGSPAMNFLTGTIQQEEDNLYVQTKSLKLPIPLEQQARYKEYIGKEITFGIRPENIYSEEFLPPKTEPFPVKAEVTVVEMMGHEAIVYCTLADGQELVARVDPRSHFNPKETVTLLFDLNRFHLFDREQEHQL
ncbi:putative sugar transporter subunit: ATP-binding component of ABC superfamily transporter [Hyella patelloides LEGE 07179]|uniref:Putative sugar transporter subunit: ATP-binding component of ABC superfamily transporter n=1 Tax=Hyella patelloides LEGE 07179 TaxID=945734 RepID=A0A563VTL6_9CYAN|nr:sn-glycerol-3-phosphate ABC transporter ATP-binding protein UgpC [Hyella patelloides]VEP14755.1 putative sugar transporter subunit: ATP-binding component of ABC superfamily transporter [Hyella patelloides LEGE 07179]